MVHKSKVMHGIAAYIDDEIVSKLNGSWKAWVIGSLAGITVSKADLILTSAAKNPMIKTLNLIDGENIDVEAIYAELLKQAQKGNVTVDVPFIGPITFGTGDVESLYAHIMGG